MFDLPPEERGAEGKDDTSPIIVPGVTAYEFEMLLDFLYEEYVVCHQCQATKELTR